MKTRILGKSGIRVSEGGLGCWQLGGDFGPLIGSGSMSDSKGRGHVLRVECFSDGAR